jgi:hypothetical protein
MPFHLPGLNYIGDIVEDIRCVVVIFRQNRISGLNLLIAVLVSCHRGNQPDAVQEAVVRLHLEVRVGPAVADSDTG